MILSYVDCGMIPFDVNWFFAVYGRPAIIFAEYASPTPGSAFNWSAVAVLMSSNPVAADGFAAAADGLDAGAAAFEAGAAFAEAAGFAVDFTAGAGAVCAFAPNDNPNTPSVRARTGAKNFLQDKRISKSS